MNIIQHIKGDTFRGATFDFEALTDEDFTLVGAAVKMEIRQLTKTGIVSLTLSDGNGITITSEKQAVIDEQIIDIPAITHYSDLETTLSDGRVFTTDETKWIIKQDVTQ